MSCPNCGVGVPDGIADCLFCGFAVREGVADRTAGWAARARSLVRDPVVATLLAAYAFALISLLWVFSM